MATHFLAIADVVDKLSNIYKQKVEKILRAYGKYLRHTCVFILFTSFRLLCCCVAVLTKQKNINIIGVYYNIANTI